MEEQRPNEIYLNGSETPMEGEEQKKSLRDDTMKQKKSFQERKAMIWDLMGGSVLEEKWIQNNWLLFALIGVMSMVNIINNYYSIGQMREISNLEEELRDYTNRGLFISSEITEREQKVEIERNIELLGLGLESSSTAPYILYRDAPKKK